MARFGDGSNRVHRVPSACMAHATKHPGTLNPAFEYQIPFFLRGSFFARCYFSTAKRYPFTCIAPDLNTWPMHTSCMPNTGRCSPHQVNVSSHRRMSWPPWAGTQPPGQMWKASACPLQVCHTSVHVEHLCTAFPNVCSMPCSTHVAHVGRGD